jgi:hypothetical protein
LLPLRKESRIWLRDDLCQHGHALVAAAGLVVGEGRPGGCPLLDGRGERLQQRGHIDGGEPGRGAQGCQAPDRRPRELVLQQPEVRIVGDQKILEEGVIGEQVVDLGAGGKLHASSG